VLDEAEARRRFLIYMGLRLLGLLAFFAGIAIIYTDVLRPGGRPQIGAIVVIAGAIGALVAPHLVKRRWDSH
jgi:hypothetical protein